MCSRLRFARIPFRVLGAFTFFALAFLPVPATAQVAAKGDPQAVAVLNQTLAVTGWASPPNDVFAQATVTQFKGDERVIQIITWKVRGADALRIEVDTPEGKVTTIRNGPRGTLDQSGKGSALPGHIAATMHSIQFPFFPLVAAVNESGAQITYRGMETVSGEDAYVIEIRARQNPENPDGALSQAWRFVLYVSSKSLLPLKLDYNRLGGDNSNVVLRCSRVFSDYRRVGAVLIPYQQADFVEGRKIAEIQLTQVQLNSGISAADFNLPF